MPSRTLDTVTSELVYAAPASTPVALPGAFVVFEGGDGAGKSTQARLLAHRLEQEGHRVVLTREPGGTEIGERLRSLVLDHGQGEVDARTEALIYAAARAAHAHQTIRPALAEGAVVVCDRYIDSSAAYQGAGRRLGMEPVTALSRWATEDLLPDLTVYLCVDPAEAARRRAERQAGPDRLESEDADFHARTDAAFHELARAAEPAGARRATIPAEGTPEEVAERIRQAVDQALPQLAADAAGAEAAS